MHSEDQRYVRGFVETARSEQLADPHQELITRQRSIIDVVVDRNCRNGQLWI